MADVNPNNNDAVVRRAERAELRRQLDNMPVDDPRRQEFLQRLNGLNGGLGRMRGTASGSPASGIGTSASDTPTTSTPTSGTSTKDTKPPSSRGEALLQQGREIIHSANKTSTPSGPGIVPSEEVVRKSQIIGILTDAIATLIEAETALGEEGKSPTPAIELKNRAATAIADANIGRQGWASSHLADDKAARQMHPERPAGMG